MNRRNIYHSPCRWLKENFPTAGWLGSGERPDDFDLKGVRCPHADRATGSWAPMFDALSQLPMREMYSPPQPKRLAKDIDTLLSGAVALSLASDPLPAMRARRETNNTAATDVYIILSSVQHDTNCDYSLTASEDSLAWLDGYARGEEYPSVGVPSLDAAHLKNLFRLLARLDCCVRGRHHWHWRTRGCARSPTAQLLPRADPLPYLTPELLAGAEVLRIVGRDRKGYSVEDTKRDKEVVLEWVERLERGFPGHGFSERLKDEVLRAFRAQPCTHCGSPANNKCRGCLRVYYCDQACQRLGWPAHKAECRKWGKGNALGTE